VCKLAAPRAPRRTQTTARLMHFVVRSRDLCLLGLRVAKIGARLIAARGDPAHTDKANECWDCERMGALEAGRRLRSRLVSEKRETAARTSKSVSGRRHNVCGKTSVEYKRSFTM
jgi:hypothetical protein